MVKMTKQAFREFLWRWAIAYPIVVVWVIDFFIGLALRRGLAILPEFVPKLFQTVLAAIPFVVLAVCAQILLERNSVRAIRGLRFAWTSVSIASICLWTVYF